MLHIRHERPDDVDAIAAVTQAAFCGMPYSEQTESFIVAALRRAGSLALSLVAERDGRVVGHIALSPVSIADGSEGWYGLGPLSVLPAEQRQGIGSRLMQAALQWLADSGAAGCVLVGHPDYYRRFGFRPAETLRLPGVDPAYFFVLRLGRNEPVGEVAFHEAFTARS